MAQIFGMNCVFCIFSHFVWSIGCWASIPDQTHGQDSAPDMFQYIWNGWRSSAGTDYRWCLFSMDKFLGKFSMDYSIQVNGQVFHILV